jgi:hypothetical protein
MDTFLLLERLAWYGMGVNVYLLQDSLKKSYYLLASLAHFLAVLHAAKQSWS